MNKKILNYIFNKVSRKFKQGIYFSDGRNFSGRICVYHRGGCRRRFCLVDFRRRLNEYGTVCKVLYDSNRSAYLGFVLYDNGYFSFIILSESNKLGDSIFSGSRLRKHFYKPGYFFEISQFRPFSVVSCIETRPFYGAAIARSAGLGAVLLYFNEKKFAVLKLSSGWYSSVPINCGAMLGAVSNVKHYARIMRKAGYMRACGFRPTVRGVAMNPCDHPHGGGNGKTNTPAMPVNPWGRCGKGMHTKNTKQARKLRRRFKTKV